MLIALIWLKIGTGGALDSMAYSGTALTLAFMED
jgi:hypothetical protein